MIFLIVFSIVSFQLFVPSEAQSGECNPTTRTACITRQYYLTCDPGQPINYATPMSRCGSDATYGSTDINAVCYSGASLQNQVCAMPPPGCLQEGVFSARPGRDYFTCKLDGSGRFTQTLLSCAGQFCASSSTSGTCIAQNAPCVVTTPQCAPAGRSQDNECQFYNLCHPNGRTYRIKCPGNTFFDTTLATCARATTCGNRIVL